MLSFNDGTYPPSRCSLKTLSNARHISKIVYSWACKNRSKIIQFNEESGYYKSRKIVFSTGLSSDPRVYCNGPAYAVQLCVKLIDGLIYQGNDARYALPDNVLQMLK